MSNIKSATPIKGFNIKTKTGVLFGGNQLFPPFDKHLLFDIKQNPHRWEVVYGEPVKVEKVKVVAAEKTPIAPKPSRRVKKKVTK